MSRTVWIALGVLAAVAAVLIVLSTSSGGGGDSSGPPPVVRPAFHTRDGGFHPHKDRVGLPRPPLPE
jgi:hypothetical protein